jgi:hypothetical protein
MVEEAKMSKKFKRLVCVAIIVAMVVKYVRLDESKKRFIKNLLKQAPYLPGR